MEKEEEKEEKRTNTYRREDVQSHELSTTMRQKRKRDQKEDNSNK